MTEVHSCSPEAFEQLRETFQFLNHEREDVRKMAVHGIAEHSKDNRDLWAFLSDKQVGGRNIDILLQYLHAGSANILGDILTILINVSAEGSCAEVLVEHKVVRKAMRLLDGMEKSALPDAFVRSVEELTFMLLSNLTASHVSAIDDLLQKEDEDMRGFYLGKLQKYYEFLTPKVVSGRAEDDEGGAGTAADASTSKNHANERDKVKDAREEQEGRDLRKWILQILLNITRTYDGQELLLEDEDWRVTLHDCLTAANPVHRLLAAQCFRNCAASQKPQFALLLQAKVLVAAVERLASRAERSHEVQLCLAEIIASMLEDKDGMALMESINAKRLLLAALQESRALQAKKEAAEMPASSQQDSRVEVLDDDGQPLAPTSAPPAAEDSGDGTSGEASAPLSKEVCDTLEKHVLPYLDDIVDAYLAPGSDEID